MNDVFKEYCLRVFSHVRPGATFLSIRNYINNFNEVSNFSVCFHASYLNAVERSFNIVQNYKLGNSYKDFSAPDLNIAREQLLLSYKFTLDGFNPNYTCAGVYEEVSDANGNNITGVKLHVNQNVLHINALKVKKSIISPGIYPKYNSSAVTIAKRYLKNKTPLKNWVQFKLLPGKFKRLVVEKNIIEGCFNYSV